MSRPETTLPSSSADDAPSRPWHVDAQPQASLAEYACAAELHRISEANGSVHGPRRGGFLVPVSPIDFMKRRTASWHGVQVELMQFTGGERVEYRFRACLPMLVAHERGTRRVGETSLEGVPRSARRDLAKKLTLVPAGHEYHE